jgi:hypothetical protein
VLCASRLTPLVAVHRGLSTLGFVAVLAFYCLLNSSWCVYCWNCSNCSDPSNAYGSLVICCQSWPLVQSSCWVCLVAPSKLTFLGSPASVLLRNMQCSCLHPNSNGIWSVGILMCILPQIQFAWVATVIVQRFVPCRCRWMFFQVVSWIQCN